MSATTSTEAQMENGRESRRRRWRTREEAETVQADSDDESRPSRGEWLVLGAETGLRWTVQLAALALWVPLGFVFWLPLLLRRTVSYVVAVLYAGLTGSDLEKAQQRWQVAVAFYRVGFQRIVYAFASENDVSTTDRRSESAKPEGRGRLLWECLWSAVVWGTLLWLTGAWPEAPEAVQTAAMRGGEMVSEALKFVDSWVRSTLPQ